MDFNQIKNTLYTMVVGIAFIRILFLQEKTRYNRPSLVHAVQDSNATYHPVLQTLMNGWIYAKLYIGIFTLESSLMFLYPAHTVYFISLF